MSDHTYGTDYPWFPWHKTEEVDRGFESVCILYPARKSGYGKPLTDRLLTEAIGERPPGGLWEHTCEKWGEKNQCIRPDHIIIGTKSSNAKRMHDLRAAAGVEWAGAREKGIKMAPYNSEPWTCPDCGREMTWHQAGLHSLRTHGHSPVR